MANKYRCFCTNPQCEKWFKEGRTTGTVGKHGKCWMSLKSKTRAIVLKWIAQGPAHTRYTKTSELKTAVEKLMGITNPSSWPVYHTCHYDPRCWEYKYGSRNASKPGWHLRPNSTPHKTRLWDPPPPGNHRYDSPSSSWVRKDEPTRLQPRTQSSPLAPGTATTPGTPNGATPGAAGVCQTPIGNYRRKRQETPRFEGAHDRPVHPDFNAAQERAYYAAREVQHSHRSIFTSFYTELLHSHRPHRH
jgi:hypothetical protein